MSEAPEENPKADASKADASKDESSLDAPKASKPDAAKLEAAKTDGNAEPAGTSLAPAAEAPMGIDPFLAKASETDEPAAPRPFYAKALDYSAHAAMIVGLVGFAWTVSDHVTSRKPVASTATPLKTADAGGTATPKAADAGAAAKPDELGDLRRSNQKMAAEIRSLHASLEALRTTVVRERSSGDDVRSLSAAVDQVKAGLAAARNEQTTQLGQLTGKIDKLQRDARQQVAERAAAADRTARAEPRAPDRREVDTTTTASIPAPAAKPVPTPPAKPTVLAKAEPDSGRTDPARADDQARDDGKPPVISGWVVRDVYQGVALIEGRRGSMEVVPGVSIPGAGVVKSIDRHGGGWTVTTTKGQLAFSAPQHEPHRGYRDYYGPRRYDF